MFVKISPQNSKNRTWQTSAGTFSAVFLHSRNVSVLVARSTDSNTCLWLGFSDILYSVLRPFSHSSRLCCKIPGTNFALHFVIWLYVWKSCVSLSFFWITQCPFFAPTPSLTPIIRSLSGRLRTLRLVWHRQPPLGHWDWFFQPGFGNQRCSPLQSTVESHTRRTRWGMVPRSTMLPLPLF